MDALSFSATGIRGGEFCEPPIARLAIWPRSDRQNFLQIFTYILAPRGGTIVITLILLN